MRSGRWMVGLAALGASACAAGPNVPPPLPPPAPVVVRQEGEAAPTFDDIFGVYEHAGGEADVEARDAAIELFLENVFFLGRGMARDKLHVAAVIDERIALRRNGMAIEVELGERFELKSRLDGPATTVVGTDGDELELTLERRGSSLVQLAKGDRGGTRRVFTPHGDGALVVQVTIYATQVEGAVDFELHYRRVD